MTTSPASTAGEKGRGSGPTLVHAGTVGVTSCDIGVTTEPWRLDIDAIVLSVGAGLGGLGTAVSHEFPGVRWKSVDFAQIDPDRPWTLDLRNRTKSKLRLAVLASPHDDGGSGPATLRSVAVATETAIRAAVAAGATALGIPLLATGRLGLPMEQVASVAIPAAINAVRKANDTKPLHRLVFICKDANAATTIKRIWDSLQLPAKALKPEATTSADPPTTTTIQAPASAFSDTHLAGGVSSDLVPNKGIPLAHDQLGVAPYVSMLATVIADHTTPLPLSVGVFGEWGSGKSYFMGLLRSQVDELAKSGNPTYCRHIDQIAFNAWHYADSNLWASLGDEIFRQLAEPGPGQEKQRDKLRAELTERLHQRKRLAAATEQARVEVAALQASVDAAAATRESGARELIVALKKSKAARKILDGLWRRLGVSDDFEQGRLLAEQMRGTLTEAEALRRAPWDRRGKLALAASVMLLVVGVFAAVLAPAAREWLAWLGGLVTMVAGAGMAALNFARSGLRKLRELSEELHAGLSTEPLTQEVSDRLDALRRAEADQRVAEAQLSEVVARVGELGRELAELTPGQRLYTFLAERASSDSYSGNLGLISTIRKDFEQLVALMKKWREEEAGSATGERTSREPVERIVLYIDDLDRCSPRQVVDVLQAVHLLLALELFVVVVGVDPRWVLRSLCSRYNEILENTVAGPEDGWQVTPEDYLEKILNIPLVLPGMSAGSLNRLLRSMVEKPEVPMPVDQPNQGTQPNSTLAQPYGSLDPAEIPIEPGSEVDAGRHPERLSQIPRPLTDPELDLLAELDPLVDTPREAKRLMNLYRMLRATRDLSEASQFLGDDQRPGEYQAVVVLLGLLTAHARLLSRVLDTPPDPHSGVAGGLVHRPPESRWDSFVSDIAPQRSDRGWTNGIVGAIPEDEVARWIRLHWGLTRVSAAATLSDLSYFQRWVPRIRRFSYALSPASGHRIGVDQDVYS
jgi:hypothetical protein